MSIRFAFLPLASFPSNLTKIETSFCRFFVLTATVTSDTDTEQHFLSCFNSFLALQDIEKIITSNYVRDLKTLPLAQIPSTTVDQVFEIAAYDESTASDKAFEGYLMLMKNRAAIYQFKDQVTPLWEGFYYDQIDDCAMIAAPLPIATKFNDKCCFSFGIRYPKFSNTLHLCSQLQYENACQMEVRMLEKALIGHCKIEEVVEVSVPTGAVGTRDEY